MMLKRPAPAARPDGGHGASAAAPTSCPGPTRRCWARRWPPRPTPSSSTSRTPSPPRTRTTPASSSPLAGRRRLRPPGADGAHQPRSTRPGSGPTSRPPWSNPPDSYLMPKLHGPGDVGSSTASWPSSNASTATSRVRSSSSCWPPRRPAGLLVTERAPVRGPRRRRDVGGGGPVRGASAPAATATTTGRYLPLFEHARTMTMLTAAAAGSSPSTPSSSTSPTRTACAPTATRARPSATPARSQHPPQPDRHHQRGVHPLRRRDRGRAGAARRPRGAPGRGAHGLPLPGQDGRRSPLRPGPPHPRSRRRPGRGVTQARSEPTTSATAGTVVRIPSAGMEGARRRQRRVLADVVQHDGHQPRLRRHHRHVQLVARPSTLSLGGVDLLHRPGQPAAGLGPAGRPLGAASGVPQRPGRVRRRLGRARPLAPTASVLIAARFITAVGGAMVLPSSLAVVLPEFPKERHFTAVACWTATGPLASALAPGGLGHDPGRHHAGGCCSRSACRSRSVPLAASWRVLRESQAERPRPAASTGSGVVMGTVVIAALVFAVGQGPTWAGLAPPVRDHRGARGRAVPAVRASLPPPPRAAAQPRRVPAPAGVGGQPGQLPAEHGGPMATWLVWPLYLDRVWGYSKVQTGLALLPGPLASAVITTVRQPGVGALRPRGARALGPAGQPHRGGLAAVVPRPPAQLPGSVWAPAIGADRRRLGADPAAAEQRGAWAGSVPTTTARSTPPSTRCATSPAPSAWPSRWRSSATRDRPDVLAAYDRVFWTFLGVGAACWFVLLVGYPDAAHLRRSGGRRPPPTCARRHRRGPSPPSKGATDEWSADRLHGDRAAGDRPRPVLRDGAGRPRRGGDPHRPRRLRPPPSRRRRPPLDILARGRQLGRPRPEASRRRSRPCCAGRAGRCADRGVPARRDGAPRPRPRRVPGPQPAAGVRADDRVGPGRALRADGRPRHQLHRARRLPGPHRPARREAGAAAQPRRRLRRRRHAARRRRARRAAGDRQVRSRARSSTPPWSTAPPC